jgi:hypothetical protein
VSQPPIVVGQRRGGLRAPSSLLGLASLDPEAEWLDPELGGPVRLITQYVRKFTLRLLSGEEGLNRAELLVNRAPEVRHLDDRTRKVSASRALLTGASSTNSTRVAPKRFSTTCGQVIG